MDKPWHALAAAAAVEAHGADPERGLSAEEVRRRLERHGPNLLTPRQGRGPLVRFLLQFHQPLVYILLAAALVTALLREWVDCSVILGVVLVNSAVGFLQESRARNALAALARTMKTGAAVLRDGRRLVVDAAELVPGDLVLLQSGDKVPADMRLVKARDLRIDESALTGESVPAEKDATAGVEESAVLADRRNMAYGSTLVTYGQASAVVVATGDLTEIGRISTLLAGTEELDTPLTRKIVKFSHLLLYVILGLAALTFVIGLARGNSAAEMFMAAVALAVGAIPEGLPAAVTITLAIGVTRMARRHAIIRRLPAVETLGSTTVICSDKTGTLTQNQMTVQEISMPGAVFRVEGAGYAPEGRLLYGGETVASDSLPGLVECLKCGVLCSDTSIQMENGVWKVHGDPTEAALLVSAAKAGQEAEAVRHANPRLDAIPFESEHQYMATLNSVEGSGGAVMYVKGAVEVVLGLCTRAAAPDGSAVALDTGVLQAEVERMAAAGLRVLAMARAGMPSGTNALKRQDLGAGLTFLGFQGMIDPPRPEAIKAVAACRLAGIRVKMITGDHVVTARAVARQVGLGPAGAEPAGMDGRELAGVADEALPEVADRVDVFARVTPEQKLRLVKAIQSRGQVVAMTGDGVNDGPALRRADIGVAMGITGTEVAKEAADMVLADDNFASIAAAVEEGRAVFDNLTKFIVWTLPTNAGEGLVTLVAVAAGLSLPILPGQILWINMTTAVLLGMMLAFEPKERGIMSLPPRAPGAPIVTGVLLGRMALVSLMLLLGSFGLYELELVSGASQEYARTVAVNVFVFGEMFYLFNCRSLENLVFRFGLLSNPLLWVGIAAMTAAQLAFTYLPVMNRLFHSTPISLASWGLVLVAAAAVFAAVSLEKAVRNRLGRAR
ncbi:MAG TPA: cation-transporting P-type ATPase [Planctomycetota bacterium]|nr:cation-transporting P-type ATPase [Planctomycetota bacterium]